MVVWSEGSEGGTWWIYEQKHFWVRRKQMSGHMCEQWGRQHGLCIVSGRRRGQRDGRNKLCWVLQIILGILAFTLIEVGNNCSVE